MLLIITMEKNYKNKAREEFLSEDNYNNADVSSGQYIETEEEIYERLIEEDNNKFYVAYNYDYEGNTQVNYFKNKEKAQDFCDKYNLELGTCLFNDNIQDKINDKIMFRIEINTNDKTEEIYTVNSNDLSYHCLQEFCQVKHDIRVNGYHSFYIFADNRREALKIAHSEAYTNKENYK